jgi:hypothetical protein
VISDPALGVVDLLVAAGIGVQGATTGWHISISKLPLEPDTAIAVVATGGLPPNPKFLLNFPSVQVQVRGKQSGYQAASTKVRQVQDALLGYPGGVLQGDTWRSITAIGDVAWLGYDTNDRPMFSVNFSLIVEPKVGGYRQAMS